MVLVKSKRDTYGADSCYLYKALNYLYDNEKALHIGGYGVNPYNLEETFKQMMFVKKYFHKTGDNPLMHFIVSFDDIVKTYNQAKWFAIIICQYFKDRYQLLWAVHRKTRGDSKYHVHIIINTVSFVDGKLYNSSREELVRFCSHIQKCTGSLCYYLFSGEASSDDV